MAGQTYSAAAGGGVQRKNNKEFVQRLGLVSRLQQGTVLQVSLNISRQDKDSAHDEAHRYQNQQSRDAIFQDNDGNEAQQECQRAKEA
jgi:hypothetical protein